MEPTVMRSTFDNTKKKCAGKGCERTGTRILKLRFLNKACDLCANGLLAGDLAVTEEGLTK